MVARILKNRVPPPPGTWQLAVRAFKKSRTAITAGLVSLAAVVQDQFSLIKDYVPEDKQVWAFVSGIGVIAFARFSSIWDTAKRELLAEAESEAEEPKENP